MGQFLNLFKQAAPEKKITSSEKKPTSPKKEATASSEKRPIPVLQMVMTGENVPKEWQGKKLNDIFNAKYLARLRHMFEMLDPSNEENTYPVNLDPKVDYFDTSKLNNQQLLDYVGKAFGNTRHFIPFGTFALTEGFRGDADRLATSLGYKKVDVYNERGEVVGQRYKPSSKPPTYIEFIKERLQRPDKEGVVFGIKRQKRLVGAFNNMRDSHIHYLSNIPGITLSPDQKNQIKGLAQQMSIENRRKADESTLQTNYDKDGKPYSGYSKDMNGLRKQLFNVYDKILKGVKAKDKKKIEQQIILRYNSAPYITNNKTQDSNTMVS